MQHHEGQEPYHPSEYDVLHFFRNVCSPLLAELLAKELNKSSFIKKALIEDREGTVNKTLYEILNNVSSKGKKNASGKNKHAVEKSDGASKTHHINNLHDNEPLLSQVWVGQLVHEADVNEESIAVRTLGKLDSALLLNILINEVLDIPLVEIEGDLNTLKQIRNCIIHNDNYSARDVEKLIWEAVESVHKYLRKDAANFQEKKKRYLSRRCPSSSLSSCCPLMKELQQEIHNSYGLPNDNHSMQPTIKHLRRDCQPNEIVENLVKFVMDHMASGSQEPQPILLCGAPGAGKSSILRSLVHALIHFEDFLLVVLMEWNKSTNGSKESFWRDVYYHLMNLSPHTVQQRGQEEVMTVLENYSSRFLFLWDMNLQDTRDCPRDMDQGTWVLSYQGVPENSTNCCVLKVKSLSEKQVHEVLRSIKNSEVHSNQVLECYRKCDFKRFINTPDMVHIFDSVCLGMTDCVPFYRLIQMYIDKKVDRTSENQVELIKLGQKAFDTIRNNKKYYPENCLADIPSHIYRPFLEHSPSRGNFFQYRVVEDCLAAWYVVKDPKTACNLWLQQATLFKRVFEIVCAVWCEEGEGIHNNLKFLREYLERLFEIFKPHRNRAKKQKNKQTMDVVKSKDDDNRAKMIKDMKAMEVDDDDSRAKKQNNQTMEVDANDDDNRSNKQTMELDGYKHNKQKNIQTIKDDDTKKSNFVRWVFISRIAKEHQRNQDILQLLAEMLIHKQTWLFKCKFLSEVVIDNISLVLRHVNLTRTVTIKVESGPNVTILSKLWNMLCSHPRLCAKIVVWLVIHHTERSWIMHEKQLAKYLSIIVETRAPLHLTKYMGPLLCSSTPQFLKCLCMARLEVLDVFVCDLASLREVLAHQQQSLISVIVRLNLKVEEQMIPDAMQVQLSPSLPLTLQIIYFESLQRLLDKFEPPDLLYSLRIYRVYIHENFKLDLRRFTKMKSLFIRFVHTGKLPSVLMETTQSVDKMEVENEGATKTPMLPLEHWTFYLVQNLQLPAYLERFLMRNLSFCDDSKAHLLYRYWEGLPFQRLVLLDTNISLSKFKSSLNTGTEDIIKAVEKKCRIDRCSGSSWSVVKQERLKKKEREERRKHKPEGKELIITSETEFCEECRFLSCTCVNPGINNSRDTYHDLVSLAKEVYTSGILNVSYSGRGIVVRKDMCGDLQVQCPVPFLDDERAQHPEDKPELNQMLEALALAQIICLSHTKLSHDGAVCLINHLEMRKKSGGTIEPFRLTILSSYYHDRSKTQAEVHHSTFMKEIKKDGYLQQFNYQCDCWKKCHNFKKSIKGKIYFNNSELKTSEEGLCT